VPDPRKGAFDTFVEAPAAIGLPVVAERGKVWNICLFQISVFAYNVVKFETFRLNLPNKVRFFRQKIHQKTTFILGQTRYLF